MLYIHIVGVIVSYPFSVRLSSLAGIAARRPVPFMEEAFRVATGTHRLARETEDFGHEAWRDILIAGRVLPGGAILVTGKLSFSSLHIQNSCFTST